MGASQSQVFMTNDLVSIIIPTYNRSWGLALAIKSVLAQIHQNYELFIVDDCSSDDTPEVAKSFKDKRISYHRQPVNVGMVKNWGEVLRLANGNYIVFLSDDDQLRPRFIANRMKQMANDPDCIVVFSKYETRDRNGSLVAVHNEKYENELTLDAMGLLRAALSRQWCIGASMYRKSAVQEVWDLIARDDLVLDLGLNVRLSLGEFGKGRYITENDFVMGLHPGQNSQAKREKVYPQASDALERILAEKKQSRYASPIKRELASWLIVWGRYLAAEGNLADARARFLKATQICPTLWSAWKQLGGSWLWPGRIVMSAQNNGHPPSQSH